MPLGETIGTAYVRVLADGTGFAEDAKRQFRRNEPVFERAGEDHGHAYNRGVARALHENDHPLDDLEHSLQQGMGRWDAIGNLMGNEVMTGLADQINARFPDVARETGGIGDVIVQNLRESLAKGDIGEAGLISRIQNIRREVGLAAAQIGHDQAKAFDELSASVDRFSSGVDRNGPSRRDLLNDLRALHAALPQNTRESEEFGNKWRDVNRKLADAAPVMNRFKRSLEGAGGSISRSFGKGSRNNFLNFFGGIVGGIAKAVSALSSFTKWPSLVVEQTQRIIAKWQQLVDEADSVRDALLNLASAGLPGLISAIATVGIMIKVLVSLAGVFGSAIVLVSGLVLALAGSLAFALVGGLVAVAGALVPFAAAIGVAALALGKMDKKSEVFKTLKKDFQDLQATAQKAIFGKNMENLSAISGIMKTLKPLVTAVGGAIGDLLKDLGKASQSKGFKDWIGEVSKLLPPMIDKIGHIAGNIGTFIGEAFVAAGPIITEFLGWLDGVTGKLADFGKGGKDSGLAKFFTDAWASAKIVGGLILQIAGAIGDLFSAGKGTGDSIFTTLTEKVKEFRGWLKKAQEDGSLQKFFDDAKRLGEKLGEIVDAVIAFVDALDTPSNRETLLLILDVIKSIIDFLTIAVTKWDEFTSAVGRALVAISEIDLSGLGPAILSFFQNLVAQIVTFFSGLGDKIFSVAGNIVSAFVTWANGLPGSVSGIITSILTAWAGLDNKIATSAGDLVSTFTTWMSGVLGAVPGIISQILGFFSGLATKIITAAGDLASSFGTWLAGLPVQVITVAGQIIVGFIDLAGRMILAAGNIIGAFTQWLADLPGLALQAAVNVTVAFINLGVSIINAAGSLTTAFAQWLAALPAQIGTFVRSLPPLFAGLASRFFAFAGNIAAAFGSWVASLPGKLRSTVANLVAGAVGLGKKIISAAGNIASAFGAWLSSLPGKLRSVISSVVAGASGLARRIIASAGSIISAFTSWLAGLPGKARSIASQVANAFSGLAAKAIAKAGSIVAAIGHWASGVASRAASVANDIVNAFRGLASRIVEAIGTIIPKISMPHITIPHITPIVDKPGATGFVTAGPQWRLIGEAGPEAVVPLRRPLSQVDPAVRMLSAIAQGRGMASGGVSPGRSIDIGGITINTPTEDPRAVASEVVAHMAVASYF